MSRRWLALWSLALCVPVASAATLEELEARIERLDVENRALREKVERLENARGAASPSRPVPPSGAQSSGLAPPSAAPATPSASVAAPAPSATTVPAPVVASKPEPTSAPAAETAAAPAGGVVRFNSAYTYRMLDPTTEINRRQLAILDSRRAGALEANSLVIGGALTAVADYQNTDVPGRFGYLMRQPGNALGTTASEAVIHSAQLQLTGSMGPWVTAYTELVYEPSQSFAAGSITALARNQVAVRSGYVVFGNLAASPFYASIGKMPTPFGLTDTVSPFSQSTVFHAFGGIAYGVQGGYAKDGLNVSAMAIQGGAQFRGANTPVDGTALPSKLNNYALNIDYTLRLPGETMVLAGASYERGSIYCQPFPVSHFGGCQDNNPAYDVYARLKSGPWLLQAEFAKTLDAWPGSFNPALPQFPASKVSSFAVGLRYRATVFNRPLLLSSEFSRFTTGPDGSPWEKQDQFVVGVAGYLTPTVKMFGEYVRVKGFIPVPFVATNLADSVTHSNVFLMGVNAAY